MLPRALVRIDNLENKLSTEIPLKSIEFQLTKDYSINSSLQLPYTYKVNSNTLKLYWEGILLNNNIDYIESGTSDTLSNTVTLNVALLSNEYLTQVISDTDIVFNKVYSSPVTSESISIDYLSNIRSFIIDGTFSTSATISLSANLTNNVVSITLSESGMNNIICLDTDLTVNSAAINNYKKLLKSEHQRLYSMDSQGNITVL